MVLLLNPMSGTADAWQAAMRAVLPEVEVRIWPEVGEPSDIEFAFVSKMPLGELKRLPRLRLIGSMLAGVDHLVTSTDLPRGIPMVRTGSPDGDPMMTEFVLLHVLRHHRRLPEYLSAQQRSEWQALPQPRTEDRRVGFMGLGSLALPAALAVKALGFQVAAWTRQAKSVDGIATFHGRAQLPDFLARTDIPAQSAAAYRRDAGDHRRKTLAMLPSGAAVVNLGRGAHVVEADLIAALDAGHISAATLDVFPVEPLPAADPLWQHPRVTVMPHIRPAPAADRRRTADRQQHPPAAGRPTADAGHRPWRRLLSSTMSNLKHSGLAYEVVQGWERLPDGFAFTEVAGVAVDSHDRVYAFCRGRHPVLVFDKDGHFLSAWGEGTFTNPHGITITRDDRVFLVDNFDHTVREYTLDGRLLKTIGEPNKPSDTGFRVDHCPICRSAGPFNMVTNVAVNESGEMFVADGYANARVHKFSAAGELVCSWGTPGSGDGEFNLPHGIAIDSAGTIYVADRENSRIQLFKQDGSFVKSWDWPKQAKRPVHRRAGSHPCRGDGLPPRGLAGALQQLDDSAADRSRSDCACHHLRAGRLDHRADRRGGPLPSRQFHRPARPLRGFAGRYLCR